MLLVEDDARRDHYCERELLDARVEILKAAYGLKNSRFKSGLNLAFEPKTRT